MTQPNEFAISHTILIRWFTGRNQTAGRTWETRSQVIVAACSLSSRWPKPRNRRNLLPSRSTPSPEVGCAERLLRLTAHARVWRVVTRHVTERMRLARRLLSRGSTD